MKLARTKRNNKKRISSVKNGTTKKKTGKPTKQIMKKPIPKVLKPQEPASEEEDDNGEDLMQMIEDEDLDFIKTSIADQSYNIYNKVKFTGTVSSKPNKRKVVPETLEDIYENENQDDHQVKKQKLLPIKNKKGVIPQERIVTTEDDLSEEDDKDISIDNEEHDEEENEQNGEFIFEEDTNTPVSEAQLLVVRQEILRQHKIKIGSLSSQLLEDPEETVTNLRTLLTMFDEAAPEVELTVRKLIIVSLLEIFKDILPSYELKNSLDDGVKLKKDTLRLRKYEENLLLYYKKYLQKLEKYCFMLRKKKGDTRKRTEEEKKLAELAISSMCDLLITHPYFNFSKNIAQAIVPFLNHSNKNVRETIKNAIKTVFKEDKKHEITLQILRVINHYLKNHAHNSNTDMLEVLLVLNLRDVNLDQDKEEDIKQKKLKAQKHKILQMSKKERKRKKKLQSLEKEMLETKAEENHKIKHQSLTEITKIVFNIYFRILKNSSNTRVLGVCLEGLAKYAHCINLEFYMDLVNVLDKLLKEDWIGYREQLHCIQTVFSVLSGVGEALTLDPTKFYMALYKDLLTTHASKNHNDFSIVLRTLNDGLIKRRKKVTNKKTIAFIKRLATLSLQLLHNGSLGCLGLIKNIMQLNRSVDVLLDFDSSVGDGKFQPYVDDPEYANASQSALYEMITLTKHYNPVVSKYARHIAFGLPTSGEGNLPLEYAKCSPEQLYTDFAMDDMAFNPPVPVHKAIKPKSKCKKIMFADDSFETECKYIFKNQLKIGRFT